MFRIKNLITATLIVFSVFSLTYRVNAQTKSENTLQNTGINQSNTQTEQKKQNTVQKVASWYMDNINYGTITLLMAVESSFIPFPSEVVIPPAAYKAATNKGELNIYLVVIFGTLGAIIGAIINYLLALIIGRPLIYKFADSRLGHMLLISKPKVIKAEEYFVKHGKSSTFIGRLVPGIRQLISIPAGIAKMNMPTFLLFTFLGSCIWNIILACLGYIAKGQKDVIEKYSSELSYVLLGLGVLFVAYLIYNGIKKDKKSDDTK